MNLLTAALFAAVTCFRVDPYSRHAYLPDSKPVEGVETKKLDVRAAKGEIESLSFMMHADADVKDFHLVPSDLKNAEGAVLPASAVDLCYVKAMWRPDTKWHSIWMGVKDRPVKIPCILLHDDDIVTWDDEKKINYLRLDYDEPVGTRRLDMRKEGRKEHFKHFMEPVKDPPALVPMKLLPKDFYQQYWLTYRVPADQAPGVYRGTLAVTGEGKKLAELELELRVYPFTLPRARTHFDTSVPYTFAFYMQRYSMAQVLAETKSMAMTEERCRTTFRSMAEHNVTSCLGPGDFGDGSTDNVNLRQVVMMRQAGIPMRPVMAAEGDMYTPWAVPHELKDRPDYSLPETQKELERQLELYRRKVDRGLDLYRKYLGHTDCVYFGVDECGFGTYCVMQPFMEYLREKKLRTFGDMAQFWQVGWMLDVHSVPANNNHTMASRWSTTGTLNSTYAAPFTGGECPDPWRRQKGLRFYLANWAFLSEYSFFEANNSWNDFIRGKSRYGQFGICHFAVDHVIPTLAYEAIREAMDDVKYYSLLRLRSQAALKSDDPAVRKLGRDNLCWFDQTDPELVYDLQAFRYECAERALALIAKIGPETSELPGSTMPPPLPPVAYGTNPPANADPFKLIAEYDGANRWDLALAVAAKTRADTALAPDRRYRAALAEAKYLVHFKRREEAVKMLDAFASEKSVGSAIAGKTRAHNVRTMLSDVVFEEAFTKADLERAMAELKKFVTSGSVPLAERAESVAAVARACVSSGEFALCVDFLEPYVRNDAFMKYTAKFRLWRAQAYSGLKEYKRATSDWKIVIWEAGMKTQENFSLCAKDAEAAEDYDTAQRALLDWRPLVDPEEGKDLRMWLAQDSARIAQKAQKKSSKTPQKNTFEENESDEEVGALSLDE